MQVISDYIQRSILTTQGDLAVRGGVMPQRLPAGLLNTVLKGQGAGALPAYLTPSIADIPYDKVEFLNVSSGNLTTSALSFAPKLLHIIARDDSSTNVNWSQVVASESLYHGLMMFTDGVGQNMVNTVALYIYRSAGNSVTGVVSNWASNGFTITMTWSGTVATDVTVLCFG